MALKENRVCLLARVETAYGVDAIQAAITLWEGDPVNNPHPFATDAILCTGVDVQADTSVLERGNYNPSFSPEETGVGRVLSKFLFKTELRSSGALLTPPRIGRLLRSANMAETIVNAGSASQIGNPQLGDGSTSPGVQSFQSTMIKTTPPTGYYDTYSLTFTTGGLAATAKVIVTGVGFPAYDGTVMDNLTHKSNVSSPTGGTVTVGGTPKAPTYTFSGTWAENDFVELFVGGVRFYDQFGAGEVQATVVARLLVAILADARFPASTGVAGVITIALSATAGERPANTAITLGASGAVVTPGAWTGTAVAGESVRIALRRVAVRYDPVSDQGTSLTMWMFLDGALFRIRGARGTWSLSGEASKYPELSWTFTGNYVDPINQALPTNLQYEGSKPFKVEVAELAVYAFGSGFTACASKFAMDIANDVQVRDCINADEAYDGVEIVARTPTASCDPEMLLPGQSNPWARMRRADATRFHALVGGKGGPANTVRVQADNAHYTAMPMTARNKIRVLDFAFRLARVTGNGDDELSMTFG